ncbi:MAG: ABC transporter permease [Rhodoferax sp.]|nr:ABC transporter permease [Actinomycetota bacterium]
MPPETSIGTAAATTGATTRDDARDLESGLDALQTDRTLGPRTWSDRLRWSVLPPMLAVLVLVALWQLVVWSGVRPSYTLASPQDVWTTLRSLFADHTALTAIATSVERGVIGFVVAVLIATPLAVLISRVRLLRASVGPLITGLQVLPSVAWVPAAILWFGVSDATMYFVILLGAVPSIINGLLSGVDQVPPLFRRVGTVLGAGRWQMVRHVILPAAMPGYVAGLRQGWAFSWRSLMAAELIVVGGRLGFGLGALLDQGRQLSDTSVVIAAILLILVVGIAVELLFFAPLERRILRSRGLAADTTR